MADLDFWDKIISRFQNFEATIRDVRFPEKRDIELYQLEYLITGEWPDMEYDERYHHFYYSQPENRMLDIIPHLAVLGLPVPEKYKDHFLFKEMQERNVRRVISETLKTQELTPEFTEAWGKYNFSIAAVMGFMSQDGVDIHEKANVKKNIPSLIERYIFAFWMDEHWIKREDTKEDARDDLADEIYNILSSKVKLPDWKSKALTNMLQDKMDFNNKKVPPVKGDVLANKVTGLKKTYTEISKDEIISMIKRATNLKQAIEIK